MPHKTPLLDLVADLQEWMRTEEENANKPPPLFKKLAFKQSATAEAFDAYAAKVKIREMEAEIRHEFLYGGLNHLGMDGLKEFYNLRREIRERRIKMLQDQKVRRQKFIEMSLYGVLIAIALGFAGLLVWTLIALIAK